MPSQLTPAQAFSALVEGNHRFISGEMLHPSQDTARRSQVSVEQNPFAVLFGCSDSRVAAEIICHRGLFDMFGVRTAAHGLETPVVGWSGFEFGLLPAPPVLVLDHARQGPVARAR